ncbi:MAG: FtsQ-type POTRA domain-containing protein [Ruminococcaceae bacterium]|nr:FtsQ-type POTRA domain-containing protein [Oscillospiraceae bacterium]
MKNQRRIEVQKRKKVFKKMVGLFLLFVLCAVIASFTPYFNIKKVNITGNSRVSVQEIEAASGITSGSNIFHVKLNSVRRRIEEISYVHSVRVKREFPNQISIEIEESEPIAAAPYMGNYVLIDVYGKTLEQETPEKLEKLPEIVILTGLEIKNFELGQKIIVKNERNLQIVLESLSELVHNSLIGNTNEIDLTNEDGVVYKMNDQKLTVLMGDASDLPYRVKFLKEIMDKLGGTPRGVIDFTAKDPTYRLSDAPSDKKEESEEAKDEEKDSETEEETDSEEDNQE